MELKPQTIETLETASAAADAWHQISAPLRELAMSPDDEAFVLASAFDYMLKLDRHSLGTRNEALFEPMLRFESGESVPPLVESVPSDWVQIWAAAAEAVTTPAARARLHDLLTVRRHNDVQAHARAAASSYLDLAEDPSWSSMDRADGLIRALELARRIGLGEMVDDLVARITIAARESVRAANHEPGVALSLLRALVTDQSCPDEVDVLLDEARERYQGAHLTESIVEIQRKRARGDVARLQRLDRERVGAWLDEADRSSGLVKVVHLETAARLARDASQRDLEEIAQQRLQAIPKDDLELEHISAEASIPEDVVEQYLAPFTGATSTRDLLVALISHPPSTGDPSDNRRAVAQSRTEFPLQYLFPRVQLGGDGLPRWTPTTDEEQEDGDLARQELLRFQIIGGLLARGLWQGGQNLSPTVEEVGAFLAGLPNLADNAPELLANAFAAYWQEQWTASLLLALPSVEASCRQLVLAIGKGIYQAQRGRRPGQYPGLGALLHWMKDEGMDEGWYRYAWTVLANPAGLNLRNEVAHGFVHAVAPLHAAAVLHIAAYLAALSVEPSG